MISIILILSISCTPKEYQKLRLADLNLFIETNLEVDSVFIANIGQDKEYHYLAYNDTLVLNFRDSVNDLYLINFYTNGNVIQNQLWLNGEQVVIKGKLTDRLEIDTIIGSNLYYDYLSYKNKYAELVDKRSDSTAINNFLWDELDKNIETPLSIDIANNFFWRNSENRDELRNLYFKLSMQSPELKSHFISPFATIEEVLTNNRIDVSQFRFIDKEFELKRLNLLSNYKLYLLDFWFMGCAPCIEDHKTLKSKLDILNRNKVQLIGISTDQNHEEWLKFIFTNDYEWMNVRELSEYDKRLTTNLFVHVFPTYILMDSEGKIIKRTFSLEKIFEELGIED